MNTLMHVALVAVVLAVGAIVLVARRRHTRHDPVERLDNVDVDINIEGEDQR